MPISWSLDDFPHFKYLCTQVLMATSGVLANWVDDFDYMTRETDWGILTYTCRLFVIGQ